MDGFDAELDALRALDAAVLAASTATLDVLEKDAAHLRLTLGYGVTRAQGDAMGAWWEERRQIVQPANFIVNDAGTVLSATYSTGPVGRLEPADAIRFIEFQEKQRAG